MTTDTTTALQTTVEHLRPRGYRVTTTDGTHAVTQDYQHRPMCHSQRACAQSAESDLRWRVDYVAKNPNGTTALLINGELAGEDSFCLVMHRTPERYLHEQAAEIARQRPEDRVEVQHITASELWSLWERRDGRR